MKLSVLVTFYNQKDYVDRALRSILLQNTDFEYEILVGDDGSTDGTLDKIKEWQAKYPNKISVYIMDRQEGKKYNSSFRASRNRINLLKYVKGKYFTYLDGDDYFCNNNKFQKQIAFLENDNEKRFFCIRSLPFTTIYPFFFSNSNDSFDVILLLSETAL